MKKAVIGILAHVDAGKTTLSEAILYKSGKTRKVGRVDSGDTVMDTHLLEKERGITIFAGQAIFELGDFEVTLLDTPGHVDFSAETERILQILDYAVLVINGADRVQSHTVTLWRLLQSYNVPTVIFVTKMDYAHFSKEEIMISLKKELSENCIDFSPDNSEKEESLAMCREDVMEYYLEKGEIEEEKIKELLMSRLSFPCFFGSGLKMEGVEEFLAELKKLLSEKVYPDSFGAKVFKITHDQNGAKLTHLKITGGSLKVRSNVQYKDRNEKISGIRIYSGSKFNSVEEVSAGSVCAVTGLSESENGMGFGIEKSGVEPILEPVMYYRVALPMDVDSKKFLPSLRLLEEEEPSLKVSWNSHLQEIGVSLMGKVQAEILKSLISERFNVDVEIDRGRVLYKETIKETVEGVGHYEPLRHYAEAHIIMTPLERGSGLKFETKCSEDFLDKNWQRLILMHLQEKQHIGVLTGSPVTDIKFTLASGRAHIKHTEGGDFRQATYRAVRQGLMTAESVLLEPYYSFYLEVPTTQIGRAISDIKARFGEFSSPETYGEMSVLTGTAPVTTLNDYAAEVSSYTGGKGRLRLTVCGYDLCHNKEEVIEGFNYNPESDLENTPDSVFCAHGGGFTVKWNDVPEYMHLETSIKKEITYEPVLNRRNFHIDDKELEAIMEREFGPKKTTQTLYRPKVYKEKDEKVDISIPERKRYLIVDGYNCIFAWEKLKSLAEDDLGAAREKLADILCNYGAFTKTEVVLVFDGYKVEGNRGESINYKNIHIAYTKENELGDVYIEKLISEIGKNQNVRVVTSDGMIQLSAVRFGVLRVSARDFENEIKEKEKDIEEFLERYNKQTT